MLFDVRQFEQFFPEKILKKGLRLFEGGELHFSEKTSNLEYHYEISSADLVLKKRGDKILSYKCTCAEDHFCEHLAAALFYFQQDELGISVKKSAAPKIKNNFDALSARGSLRRSELTALSERLRQDKGQTSKKELDRFFSNKKEIDLYDLYCAKIKLFLDPYRKVGKLEQEQIDEIVREASAFIGKLKRREKSGELFFMQLAMVTEFNAVLRLRMAGSESGLVDLIGAAYESLSFFFAAGLSKTEQVAWMHATLFSIDSNMALRSEAFAFLLPRALTFIRGWSDLEKIADLLNKRKFIVPYSQRFDKLLIAKWQLAVVAARRFNSPSPFRNYGSPVELLIAKAELEFCGGNVEAGFSVLEAGYEEVKSAHRNYCNEYLNYITSKAKEHGRKNIEISYLKESFINGLFILSENLDRFLSLMPEKRRSKELNDLVATLKEGSRLYSFDKMAALLLKTNRVNELVEEIKKQHNKFSLLHKIALQKLPEYDEELLSLYVKHLTEAFESVKFYRQQVQVFDTAKSYIDKLPAKTAETVAVKILDNLGHPSQIYRYINALYNFPLLKINLN